MNKAWMASMCALGIAACGGEEKPAQAPTTTTTTGITETTTTRPRPATTLTTPPMTPRPAPTGADMTAPLMETMPGTSGSGMTGTTGTTTDTTGLPGPTTPSTAPSVPTGISDKSITASIKTAVASDAALAAAAKNVKITTVSGKVTLRGTVKSDDEKSAIESKARGTLGVTSVDNQLQVAMRR